MESIKIHRINEILYEHYNNKKPDLLTCKKTIGKIYDVLYPMPHNYEKGVGECQKKKSNSK